MAGAHSDPIDYNKLSDALSFYTNCGYDYVETPWLVSQEAINETIPVDRTGLSTEYGSLVGSAEQGFIELLINGRKIKKSCSISPCFRDEPVYDSLHQVYFMKLELFEPTATVDRLESMLKDAQDFYSGYLEVSLLEISEELIDIIDSKTGIELGSYGFRHLSNGTSFIYGTGLALPRLDVVLALLD